MDLQDIRRTPACKSTTTANIDTDSELTTDHGSQGGGRGDAEGATAERELRVECAFIYE